MKLIKKYFTGIVFLLGLNPVFYGLFAQTGENPGEFTSLDERRKEILSKMTMNYFSYHRGISSKVVSDIRIVDRDSNSDITYHNVVLDDQSFFADRSIIPNAYADALSLFDIENVVKGLTEPYYAIKYYRFLNPLPNLGLGVDFTHFKVFITDFDQNLHRTGTENGVPVNNYIRAGDYFRHYSISHGINHIALSAIYRLMFFKTDKIPDGIVQPYAGLGFGPSIPHGELTVVNPDGITTTRKVYSYRVDFPNFGFDLCLGIMIKPDPHFSINLVYKYTYSMLGNISFDNGNDGYIETFFEVNHLQWGLSFIF
jgi:hypothetical protein